MSKSLGNFVLVNDIIKEHDPQVLRFFMLSVHYRHPINYSVELLENAKAALDRIKTSYQNLKHRLSAATNLVEHKEWLNKINSLHAEFIKEMDDDFNTANGISVLFELSKQANYYLMENHTDSEVLQAFIGELEELSAVLGISLKEDQLLDEEIEKLIEERIQARKNRDFKRSDEIRDELKAKNIILEDTPQGTRWKRG